MGPLKVRTRRNSTDQIGGLLVAWQACTSDLLALFHEEVGHQKAGISAHKSSLFAISRETFSIYLPAMTRKGAGASVCERNNGGGGKNMQKWKGCPVVKSHH